MTKKRAPGGVGAGFQPPPINPKSQELLDAVNALAYGVNNLADVLPDFMDKLEVVSQQFAVLIASQAEQRQMSADKFANNVLHNLADRVFGGGPR